MITQEYLKSLFTYDPEVGIFYWAVSRSNAISVGQAAGCPCGYGYIYISIDKRRYVAQQLAWLWVYGEWPTEIIDHIDRDPTNNKIANLRLSNKSLNAQNNVARARHDFGVYYSPSNGKWRVQLYKNKQNHYFGSFADRKAAIEIAQSARKILGI